MSKRYFLVTIIFSIALTACGEAPTPTPTPIFSLATPVSIAAPTGSAPVTIIASSPTEPSATIPTVTPAATQSAGHTPAATAIIPAGKISVKIFVVALDDNGKTGKKIGCNDSIIAVERLIPETLGVLGAALNELFSLHEKNIGASGLYNALYQSTLKVDGINIVGGRATIALSGKLVRGGVCDDPRIKAQIEETALQFNTVRNVAVTINGVPIDKALSEK